MREIHGMSMMTRAAWRAAIAALTLANACAIADESRSVRIIESAPAVAPPEAGPTLPAPEKPQKGGVLVDVLPQRDFVVGQPMSFRVTTEKAGYIVLVDVDAAGKLSQIYPNMLTLSDPKGLDEKANYLKPGQSITLPDAQAGANFRFIASPPAGIGMVIAILSDTPVQVIDLPDVPTALAGQRSASDFIIENTRSLQILPAGESAVSKRAPKWAFATQFYGIK